MTFRTLAIIPARGGSKGIPRKNIQLLSGKPLISYAISASLASRYVNHTFVTSDDPDILEISSSYGASTLLRPSEFASDTSSSEDALYHALTTPKVQQYNFTHCVFLQCTSPFTSSIDIDTVFSTLLSSNSASAFAATPWHGFLWSASGEGLNHDHRSPRQRRQDLPPTYLESGSIYCFNIQAFLKSRSRFPHPCLPVSLSTPTFEIDTPLDFQICDHLTPLLLPHEE